MTFSIRMTRFMATERGYATTLDVEIGGEYASVSVVVPHKERDTTTIFKLQSEINSALERLTQKIGERITL